MSGMTAQLAAGSSLQTAVARVAQFRANTHRDTTGLCSCSGGNGHCHGCDVLPVFSQRIRLPGPDGVDGQDGASLETPLSPGSDGRPGEGSIVVQSRNGQEQTYRSRYNLELVGFDVEDENEDGIFEPGEHLFVRRIQIRNSGILPSPFISYS